MFFHVMKIYIGQEIPSPAELAGTVTKALSPGFRGISDEKSFVEQHNTFLTLYK